MIPQPREQRESARQRALRIRLDYVARRDSIGRWKSRLAIAALLLAGLYGIAVWWFDAARASQLCPAPVAAVHARFAADCQACHAPFVPLRQDSSTLVARLLRPWPTPAIAAVDRDAQAARRATTSARCQTCHPAAAHHRLERPEQIESCAACHQEHRGSTARLRDAADRRCTSCHGEIAGHRQGASALDPVLADVRRFTDQGDVRGVAHPEFRSLRSDPGTIKFDHRLHMTPGLPRRDASGRPGRPLKTLADLPPEVAERYRRAGQQAGVKPDDQYLVSLDCHACHQGDSAGEADSRGPAHYRPVRFERDCQACHPLPFDAARRDATLPHGLDPDAIRTFLRRFYAAGQSSDAADRRGPWAPPNETSRPAIPGRAGDEQARADVVRDVSQQVTLAVQFLERQQVCAKCHDLVSPTSATASAPTAKADRPDDAPRDAVLPDEMPPRVERAGIPTTWFQHARFDHRPHGMVECAECHSGTRPGPQNGGEETLAGAPSRQELPAPDRDVVMIGGRDLCVRCHGGATQAASSTGRAARADCVLCHRYHGADHAAPDRSHAHSTTTPGAVAAPAPLPRPETPRRSIREWLEPSRTPP